MVSPHCMVWLMPPVSVLAGGVLGCAGADGAGVAGAVEPPVGLAYKSHCHASPRNTLRSMGLHVLTTPVPLYCRMASPYAPIIHGSA